MNSTTMTAYRDVARRTSKGGYENLEPRFTELATLDQADPARARLREDIITAALPLAEHIAMKFAGRGENADDLVQVAMVGLVQAVDRFDVTVGASFVGFAVPTIMGEVRRHFRDRTWAVRVPRATKELQQRLAPAIEVLSHKLHRMPTAREIAAHLDVDLVEVTQALIARNGYAAEPIEQPRGDDDSGTSSALDAFAAPDPGYNLLEDAITVGPLLAALPERDRQVLMWRFGDNLTQSEIAKRLGISQMQVSRILTRVLTTLREQALSEPAVA
ncbi:SigB/SigF/SigG family RNA polymerase sigma factor [Nocardia asteroides]|uniref:SigB/SigF/SigG family RNA polymerase sigma factor n=1 Tax=Nocardia asteroides TaxID=1824 RepID=UPI001E5823CB|nr:SigB/SigF/SigG family RNA polymerase sigma factor [Nocardia asteroides]UGT60323.1 SigB/SigF/SigG family RNA polymerase sigma factor [Nocardia asteroides]